jgi:prepilin-type N-terminal cleavage/methylation domain-containing protein
MDFCWRKSGGFTLIEICIVLIISGLLLTAGLKAFNAFLMQQKVGQTTAKLKEIEQALDDYVMQNGFYPCPAPIDAAPNTPAFGKSTNCGGPAPSGTHDVNGRSRNKVRIGGLPVRTLGLADSYASDGWHHRYSYAVTRDLAKDNASFDAGEGAITIKDINGNAIVAGTAQYALISHGPDGKGAHATGGGLYGACGAAPGKDTDNCNAADATFTASEDRSTSQGANHFDDFVSFRMKATASTASGTWCGVVRYSGRREYVSLGATSLQPPLGCPRPNPWITQDDVVEISTACGEQAIEITCREGQHHSFTRTIHCPSGFKAMVVSKDYKTMSHTTLEDIGPTIDGATGSETITCIKQ